MTWLWACGVFPILSGACAGGLAVGDGTGGGAGELANGSGGKVPSSGGRSGSGSGGSPSAGGGEADGGTAGALESAGGAPSGSTGGRNGAGGASGGAPPTCVEEGCPEDASCVTGDGEPFCECDEGFEADGEVCVDIDECEEDNDCSPDALCENQPGDYECACKEGFLGDGRACVPRTRLVSATAAGVPGNTFAQSSSLSADGRFVSFYSGASDLVAGDINGEDDVFVFDRTTGKVERVSVDSFGGETNDWSYAPSLSADGRFVVFASYATNLVSGDTNDAVDVFRRDRTEGTTIRVSVPQGGGQAIGAQGYSAFPTISNDGTRVAFTSLASNLVSGDTNDYLDQFVRNITAATTTRVSVTSGGAQVTGITQTTNTSPQISGNGRYVVFVSLSPQLGGSNDTYSDVFRRDLMENTTVHVSYGNQGQANDGHSTNPSPSADGRFIAFQSKSSTLVAGDTNNADDIFIRDMTTGTIERVSLGDDEAQANAQSFLAFQRSVSNDGRYVVFASLANNLVANDTNGYTDVFVRDRLNGTTTRVSVGPKGEEADAPCSDGTISADGRVVSFQSASSTFGFNTQGRLQVWVRDLSN